LIIRVSKLAAAIDHSVVDYSGDLIADRRYQYGRDLAGRGDFSAAADLFAQAIEAAPTFAPAWFALGESRGQLGDRAAAAAAFREALRHDPADRLGAALHLARLGEADAAAAMSAAYVRTLFDQYASRFDDALEGLAYRGPARLRAAVEAARRGPNSRFGAVLDLGCGTGLAGAAFRSLVGRLTGVDLSAGMVEQARAKGLYDRLETAELLEFLAAEEGRDARYDLVIAADVFVYLFDLRPVVAAVAAVLEPGSLFAFTVETHGGDGVELGEKLRYRHGANHVSGAIAAAGLRLVELSSTATRTEARQGVPGLLVVATRPDDDNGTPAR
jgi:predicted TPR repeat methyltransferase